ncbi:hypothetical protein Aperf_G00000004481 [Anoplocephala perfoliata]
MAVPTENAKTYDESENFARNQRASKLQQLATIDPLDATSTNVETINSGLSGIPVQDERVTIKLDVAHTEHSHLIGRSGHCVKAMMLDTSCHIHFPDSNRAPNAIEKSNQVTVSGRPMDVERARKRIRQMLPLVYIFTLQNASPHALTLYRTSYIVQHLETKFSVEVAYRYYFAFPLADLIFQHHSGGKFPGSSNTIVVSVRGLTLSSQQVIGATNILLEHHFGKMAEHTNVWMTTDIEPKNQFSILSQVSPRSLVAVIHDITGARVWFPSGPISLDPTLNALPRSPSNLLPIPSRHNGFYAPRFCTTPTCFNNPFDLFQRPEARTMVTIYGSVYACFTARQILMNLLPVSLIAEISNEEAFILSQMDHISFKSAYDVTVALRAKPRHSFRQSLVLKTNEANVGALYTAFTQLKLILRSYADAERQTVDHRPIHAFLENIPQSINYISMPETVLSTSLRHDKDDSEYEKIIATRRQQRSMWRFPGLSDVSTSTESNSGSSSSLTPYQPDFHPASADNVGMQTQKICTFAPPRTDSKLKSSERTVLLSDIFERFSLSSKASDPQSFHCERTQIEEQRAFETSMSLDRCDTSDRRYFQSE